MAEDLRAQQFAFARHLRDPARNAPPPGIEDRRMAVYRDLFFNNIESLLAGNFPVIRKTLGDAAWRALARDFYAEHRSHTPLFPEIAREFIRYLEAREDQARGDPAWLRELAHYEWVELALQISDEPIPAHDAVGDLMRAVPCVSPFAWALAYTWPVPRIGPDFQPSTPPETPTLLLVRRDFEHRIHFAEVSPLVFRLWQYLEPGALTGEQALTALAEEAGVAADTAFLAQGAAMLERMRVEGSLLGIRAASG